MWDVLVCLVLHQFVNGPILFFRLLALQPYVDQYLRQHVEHLQTLELSDWDALKAVYEVLGLTRETMEWLEGEHIATGCCAPKVSMVVCVHRGPMVPFRLGRNAKCLAMHRCPFGSGDGEIK